MRKRVTISALILFFLLLLVGAFPVLAQGGGDPVRGAALYAENCLACHGPLGEPRASHPAFAATVEFNTAFFNVTERGIARTYMGPWGDAYGGPLSTGQINDLLAYAQTWTTGDTPPLPAPEVPTGLEAIGGDPALGAALYAVNCAGCHGQEGAGRGLELYPPLDRSADLAVVIRRGVAESLMPPFAQVYGGPLNEADLDNLLAYIRTWETPTRPRTAEQAMPQGAGTLILLIGIGAVLLVGLAVLTQRSSDVAEPGENRA